MRCSDGLLVEVDVEIAKKFGTLRDMLFAAKFEANHEIPLKIVSSTILKEVIQFVEAPDDSLDKVYSLFLAYIFFSHPRLSLVSFCSAVLGAAQN
jgi:hypothetical protein